MKSAPHAKTFLFMIAAGLVVLAGRAEAQFPLSPTIWDENISLTAGPSSSSVSGSDPAIPEPLAEELSGLGYDVAGSIGFGSAEPPVGTAQVDWDVSEGSTSLQLSSVVSIDFQCRVVETATPPVDVSEVPVHLMAAGDVSAEDVFGSRATSSFRFQAVGTAVLITANLDISGDTQTSDAFSIDETPSLPVGTLVLVGMSASASMNTVSISAVETGSAMGMIDPVIEIADEIIPGTTDSYRDFFSIEFSEGYDAQTPVKRVTIGELKRRFSLHR